MEQKFFTDDYQRIKRRIFARALASDVIANTREVGFWIKDLDYKFLEISECAAEKLYGRTSDDCIGKTDFQIMQENGGNMPLEQFCEVCRGSDIYTIEHGGGIQYFYEFLTDFNGNPVIWRTMKGVQEKNGQKYLWGVAWLTETLGLDVARILVQQRENICEKLNDGLWVIKWSRAGT